jgi:hypothetical protein
MFRHAALQICGARRTETGYQAGFGQPGFRITGEDDQTITQIVSQRNWIPSYSFGLAPWAIFLLAAPAILIFLFYICGARLRLAGFYFSSFLIFRSPNEKNL